MKLAIYAKKFVKVLSLNRDYIRYLGKRRVAAFSVVALLVSILNSLNYVALIPLASQVIDGGDAVAGSGFSVGVFRTLEKLIPGFEGRDVPLVWMAIAIVLTFVIKMLLNLLFSFMAGWFGEGYLVDVRRRLISAADRKAFEGEQVAPSLMYHHNNMITKVGTFNWSVFSLVLKLASSLFLFASLILISWNLAAISIGFVLVWVLFLIPVFKFTRVSGNTYAQVLRKIQAFVVEEIESREVVKVFRMKGIRNSFLNNLSQEAVRNNAYLSSIRTFVNNFQELLVVATGVLVLSLAKNFDLEVGYIVAYGYLFAKFIGSLNEAGGFMNSSLEMMPPTEEVLDFIDSPSSQVYTSSSLDLSCSIDRLKYRNLSFSWGDSLLFSVPSLEFNVGDRVLIRGKNGEGKSTLLRLLSGLIHGKGEFSWNESSWEYLAKFEKTYSRVSLLTQHTMVFDGLLVENILLNSGKSSDDLARLVQKMGLSLDEYFPNWQTFKIQEGAKNLSGGELQIISILRALIRDFDVIFIDEFTNHLSQKLTEQVDGYLAQLENKIVICVSHAPVKFFNREFLLQDGKLEAMPG